MDRYAKACRICLKEDGISVPIFGEEGRYRMVAEKIRDCLNIPAYHNDPLPKRICNRCFYKLDVASELKVLSQRSSAIFVQILSTLKNSSTAAEYIRRIQDRPNTQLPSQATALGQKRKFLEPRKPGENADTPGPAKKRPPVEAPINRTTPATMSAAFLCELCDKTFELKQSLAYHKHKIHGLQLLGAGAEDDALQMMQLYEETSPMHQEVSPLMSKTPEMPILLQEVTPPLNKSIENVKVTEKGNRSEKILTRGNATSSDETPRKSKRLSLSSSSNVQSTGVTTPPKAKHAKPSKKKKMTTKESEVMQENVPTVTENMDHSKNVDTETEEEPFLDVEDELINDQASDASETSRTRGYQKALPCGQCDQKFYLLVNLQSHMQVKHGAGVKRAKKTITDIQKALHEDQTNETPPGQEDEVFECDVCFRIFRTKAKFDEHCEKAHSLPNSSPAKSDVVQPASENVAVEAQSKKDSNTEIRTPTADTRLVCSLCSSKFRNNIGLTMHIRNVHKKLICSDCHDIFDEQSELDDHILVHILQTQFNTDQVQNSNKTSSSGKKSSSAVAINSEDTNRPSNSQKVIQCLYCYHSCIQPSQMINHISRAHKLHGCDECWDAFATKDDMKEHKENFHSDTDPSDKIKTLELKIKTLSEESTNLDLKCKICNANFLFRNALFLHINKYHKKETCHFCLIAFKPEEMETHKTSCPLKNKNCNTNDTSKMSDHKKVGQNVVPAKTPVTRDKSCFYCEQKCGSYTELWSHLHARHSTEAKFQCKFCDCIFYNSNEYLAHEEWENSNPEKSKMQNKQDQRIACAPIEIGQKHQCPLCQKIFTTSWQHVRRHVVQVHKHSLFRCHQCPNMSFLEEESLKFHISKEHPKLKVTQPVGTFYSKQSHRNETTVDNKVDSSVGMLKSENVKVQPNITSKDKQKIVCKYCCKMYASSDLMSHLKNIHPTEFFCSCNMCDKMFFNIDDLTQHELHVHSDKTDAGPSKTEKVKHSSNQHTDRKGTDVVHKQQTGSSQKSSLHTTSPIDSVIKVASPSKHPPTESKTSSSSVKSSSEDTSYKITVNDVKQQGSSQKISFPFKLKAASPPENKSKTSQKPKPLKCQFCDEVMFSAATLIDHLQQHAKNSF